MPVKSLIIGNDGVQADVTPNAELLVTTLATPEPTYILINLDNTAFNFFEPVGNMRFRIAGVLVKADRVVGVNGAIVTIYESKEKEGALALVEEKILWKSEVSKEQFAPPVPIHQARSGFFINAKSDDSNIHITIYGNFVPTPTESDTVLII